MVRGRLFASLTFCAFLFSMVAIVPDASGHPGLLYVPPPNEGMKVAITIDGAAHDMTFQAPELRWVGHMESRETVLLDPDGNHSIGHHFDTETNRPTHQGIAGGYTRWSDDMTETLASLGLWDPEFSYESQRTSGSFMVWNSVPEWTVWSRVQSTGMDIEVPMAPFLETPRSVRVLSDETMRDGGIDITVRDELHLPHGVLRVEWSFWVDGSSPFGTDRTRSYSFLHDNGTVSGPFTEPVPVEVLEAGGDLLPFEGNIRLRFTADRDRSYTYGTMGLVPFDPTPHPVFDLAEAASLALALDDGEVRAFLSQAEDPILARAEAYTGTTLPLDGRSQSVAQHVTWGLDFRDPSGAALEVVLKGAKVAGLPLVVYETEADRGLADGAFVPLAREGLETAAFGDALRRMQSALTAVGDDVYMVRWSLHLDELGRLPLLEVRTLAQDAPLQPGAASSTVGLDLSRGVVWEAGRYG